jgi:hypothetical protein
MRKPWAVCLLLFPLLLPAFGRLVPGGTPGQVLPRTQAPKKAPIPLLPDLRIRSFELLGEPKVGTIRRDGRNVSGVKQDFRLVVENAGPGTAGEFRIGITYEMPGKPAYRVSILYLGFKWFLTVSRLEPGQTKDFSGYLFFDEAHANSRGQVVAAADIVDQEFMPDYGRVREMNESNNAARSDIMLPPIFHAAPPPPRQMAPPPTFSITEALLDILGSTIHGRLHLNNDNGHSDDDHFTTHRPYRANDSRIEVNDYAAQFTLPEAAFTVGAMDYRYYVRDLDAEFGGGAGFRGRDLLGIRDGRLVLTIRFETGGRVELRGWELTTGIYYDLSAPDIDITRLDVFVYLVPFLRDDGVFTYSDVRVVTDLAISFIGAYDTVLMNDIRSRVRGEIADQLNTQIRAALLRPDIKSAFETAAMAAFHELAPFTKLTRMIAEGDRITFEWR